MWSRGGRREEEEELQGLEGQGGHSPAQAQFQPSDSLRRGQGQVLSLLGPPSSGPGWAHAPLFPFSSSLKALETHGLSVPLSSHRHALSPLVFSFSDTMGASQDTSTPLFLLPLKRHPPAHLLVPAWHCNRHLIHTGRRRLCFTASPYRQKA